MKYKVGQVVEVCDADDGHYRDIGIVVVAQPGSKTYAVEMLYASSFVYVVHEDKLTDAVTRRVW